ncbi:alpha-amylase family glycosyl hydrolase [Anaerocolumna xylanovorans]|uniref:Glycosidase n=1 Tax=Anaerocolumna xylanovorans DSM 12503 TaxID=1121345 RepID=A0A1M7Y9Q3_9FIRM|nr:alpha-amylase family glycosyl hydrolase [Anaerocolumna xylanovorans]SHO49347.1 Glycosidase [Anaerocolumna xylanovorans DSM 12503]
MRAKQKEKRLVSLLLIVTLLFTMFPSMQKAYAEGNTAVRSVTDEVSGQIGGQAVPLSLYQGGIYEGTVNAVSGSAITIYVNGQDKGSTNWSEGNSGSVYVRYNSKTGEVTNSISDPGAYKSSATWVGNFSGLGLGINSWTPSDANGDLNYLGGGIYAKTFTFPALASDVTIGDGGYKVAYNHDWGQGEVGDDKKVSLTVPAGSTGITVFADTNTGYITDSVNTPSILQTISLIGTAREAGGDDWNTAYDGYDFRSISQNIYLFDKTFLAAGTYEYKYYNRSQAEWIGSNNKAINIENGGQKVLFLYDKTSGSLYDTVNDYNTIAGILGFPASGETETLPDVFPAQQGGNSVWRVTGSLGEYDNWDIGNGNTVMTHLVGEYYAKSMVLPAGTYDFKFTKNGSWNSAIGSDGISDNAANFSMTLAEKSKVNFYLNDELEGKDKVRTNITALEEQGIKQYTPALSESSWPRLVGSLQEALSAGGNWTPDQSNLMFVDYYFNNSVYKIQRTLPKGSYECKVVFGDNWDSANYGDPDSSSSNLAVNVLDDTAGVTFSIDTLAEKKLLTHNYKPKDSLYDGVINKSALFFDSRDITYKKPFGAVKENSEDVTFRIAAEAGDAQLVKLELIDYNGVSRDFDMSVATVLDGKDYWEVTVPKETFNEIGIWSYKFIVIDQSAKFEYGDDGLNGGTGAVSEDGQTPYNLTVYDSNYETPDWMKNAVVYQIFPDRFYDGDASNNHAKDKDGSRGDKVQLFDGDKWSALPENPRQSEEANKPYYPNATTDGVWTNEFYGGDIKGIEKKLSYLKTLGVTAIYLNPVSWAASNHKYDATDYKHLDPMFGEPVYNTPGDPSSGLNYEATKAASDKVYTNFSKVCKELGIHLISDGVFNHVGDDSIYFDRYEKYPEIGAYEYWSRVWQKVENDKVTQAEAEKAVKNYYKSLTNPATGKHYTDADFCYINWFKVGPGKVYDDKTGAFVRYDYEGWWGYDSLPVVTAVEAESTNLTNDAAATIAGAHEYNNVNYRENVIGYDLNASNITNVTEAMKNANSQRWLYMGSSGWRLDVAPDVSDDTWRQFRTAVKSAAGKTDINGEKIDDPVILGEEWNVATKYLLGDMFDSVMNYQFRAALQGFLVNGGDASDFNNALEVIRENYPKEAWQAMLNLVDSHDTVRNITKIDNPTWEEENTKNAPDASERAIKLQALTAIFQLSYPGAPTIYYGDEVGVTGTKDPDSRRSFPWERVTEQTDGSYKISDAYAGTYGNLFDSYVKASEVRNAHLALFATGDIKTAYAQGEVIAYARKSAEEGGLSLINSSDKAADVVADVKDFLPEGLTLQDELGSGVAGTVTDGKITLHVPAYTGLMMVSTAKLTALPAAPAGVTATASEGTTATVDIKWTAVEGAEGYYVYRTLLEGKEAVLLNSTPVTGTEYTDSTVTNGTRYYYYVKTVTGSVLSISSAVATAMPSFKITEVTTPTVVSQVTIGVGKKTDSIEVKVTVPGLTDNASYIGKDAAGLKGMLGYYKDGSSKDSALFTKLRYEKDEGSSKVYTAFFEPTEEGTYKYFAKVTVNNGYTYAESQESSMTAVSNFTQAKPDAPVLEQPIQESSRVTLKWSTASGNESGFEIYRTKVLASNSYEEKIAVLDAKVNTYTDFLVSNDTTYTYRVAAFNSEYNRNSSNLVTVTPKLTMVEVTVRLHIPDKVAPAATDNIYVAGDANGWNSSGWLLKKPSGATDNTIVEYTFKMMSGKKLQYKYTRGTWATEALTSNIEGDTTSPGNYGYSSTDTNINVTITNQGGNKMLINDYVLRWVDMPIMITVPRISYNGQDIQYTTTDSSFNLQASVPYGGVFTINGKDINTIQAGALDAYGNVRLNNIPLSVGENIFALHIEPTEATKAMSWLKDTGRITTQMTASVNIKITRTKDSGSGDNGNNNNGNNNNNNNNGSNSSNSGSNNAPSDKQEPGINGSNISGWENIKKELKTIAENAGSGSTGSAHSVKIAMNKATAMPGDILTSIKGKNVNLVLDYGTYTWTINGKSIQDNTALAGEYNLSVSEVTNGSLKSNVTKAVSTALKESKLKNKNVQIKQIEVAQDGKIPFTADLSLTVPVKYAGKYIFLNYYNESTKKIEIAGYGLVQKDGKVTFTFKHLSVYSLTSVNLLAPSLAAKKTVSVGKTVILKPSNLLTGAKVTYSLSKKGMVTLSKDGKVKGLKAGSVTVTAKVVQAGSTYSLKTTITVKAK